MIALTLRCDATLDDAARGSVDAAVRARAGAIAWRTNERLGTTYACVEVSNADDVAAVRAAVGERMTVMEAAVIALAVYPTVPEALPFLAEALGGSGRPAGVCACRPCRDGLVVEWEAERSAARLIWEVIDVELARFASGRTAELLSPLTPGAAARVAADGLSAPEIASDRILETLIERAELRA